MATRLNLLLDQGADFTFRRSSVDLPGLPSANVTGYQARAEFRQHFSSVRSYPINATIDAGVLTLSIPSTVTTNARHGRYVYDVELTSPEGTITRVLEGILTINPEVTRLRVAAAPPALPAIEFQFFGIANVPYLFIGDPSTLSVAVATTPAGMPITAHRWQRLIAGETVWTDIVSGVGGMVTTAAPNSYMLEFTPPDGLGATVRLFVESGISSAASPPAQFFFSPS